MAVPISRNCTSIGKSFSVSGKQLSGFSFHRWCNALYSKLNLQRRHFFLKSIEDTFNLPNLCPCTYGTGFDLNINYPKPKNKEVINLLKFEESKLTPDFYKRIIEEIFGPGSFSDNRTYNNSSAKSQTSAETPELKTFSQQACYFTEKHPAWKNEDMCLKIIMDDPAKDTPNNSYYKDPVYVTTFQQEEERLEQKLEDIKKVPIEEQEENSVEDLLKTQCTLYSKKIEDTKGSGKKSGMDKALDELASRCLNSPTNRIDERLLKELKKFGVPNTPYKRRHKFLNKNIIQSDIMKNREKNRPVDLEFSSMEDTKMFVSGSVISTSTYVVPFCKSNFSTTVRKRDFNNEKFPLYTKSVY